MAIGILFYIFKVQVDKKVLLMLFFVLNLILQMPNLFLMHQKFGIDFKAYINQAGQVWNGQRDYDKL